MQAKEIGRRPKMNSQLVVAGATALIITLGGLFLAGALAKVSLRKKYPPIGQMVDVGGFRLHAHIEGRGSPAVVLDSGAGGVGLMWEFVRPAIARFTQVVVYDRAGLGWSDPSPRPRTADVMAEELHALLANAAISGPYILVGWSLGGPVARQFTAKYPAEVAGMVLVDSAHEQQVKRFPARLTSMFASMSSMFGLMKALANLGVFALRPAMLAAEGSDKLPAAVTAAIRGVMASSGKHLSAMVAETEAVAEGRTRPVESLGNLPLIVLSHGRLDANAVPPSLGPEVLDEYERTWQAIQVELAALSTRGKRIVAERSGHAIPVEQPDLVIEAITELVEATRTPFAELAQAA
jgi:pimeloyl-ACP methyl ester carboxylesterase